MRAPATNDSLPMQLGPKVPSTAVTHEREQTAAQAFSRVLFESVDLGSLVGITEAECQQKKSRATSIQPHPLFGMLVPLVTWNRRVCAWQVQIFRNSRMHFGGTFKAFDAAVQARDQLARQLHGEFYRL